MTKKMKRYLETLCQLAFAVIGAVVILDLTGPVLLPESYSLVRWVVALIGAVVIGVFLWWGFVRMRDGDFLTDD